MGLPKLRLGHFQTGFPRGLMLRLEAGLPKLRLGHFQAGFPRGLMLRLVQVPNFLKFAAGCPVPIMGATGVRGSMEAITYSCFKLRLEH